MVKAGVHNVVHLMLMAMGTALLALALVDWLPHPLTLLLNAP
jgi:hypothetical protein